MADIWYATSPDGFRWEEQGPAVRRGVPDAFTDSGDGRGLTWGLAHIQHENDGRMANGYLVRFDCNLSRDVQRADFYRAWNYRFPESVYFSRDFALSDKMKAEAILSATATDEDTVALPVRR